MMKNASLMVSIISLSVFLIVSYTIPAADFNGDGTNDIGIFRPTSGLWAIRGVTRVYFGSSGDNPMPGDYNGLRRGWGTMRPAQQPVERTSLGKAD